MGLMRGGREGRAGQGEGWLQGLWVQGGKERRVCYWGPRRSEWSGLMQGAYSGFYGPSGLD